MKPALILENVTKKYSRNASRHLNYGARDLFAEIFGRRGTAELREDEFRAVDDLSFQIEPGTAFALIGRNGSGKTTTLRLANGLIKPDAGKIIIHGRIQALIALGAGFNQLLSGRENIYNAAAVMGFSRADTARIFDAVVDFSELEEFIDSPVQTYSSGMFARLGFSVAIHLDPDILLIDEILSVGDFAFKNKCFTRMFELVKQGTTIVLVSHSHTQVTQLCDHALWMDRGRLVRIGPAKEVVKAYIDHLSEDEAKKVEQLNKLKTERKNQPKPDPASMIYGPVYRDTGQIEGPEVRFLVGGREADSLRVHQPVTIAYRFRLKVPVRDLNVTLSFYRKDGLHLTAISTLNGDLVKSIHEGEVACEVTIPDLNFNPGRYVLVMPVHEGHSYLYRDVVKEFAVVEGDRMTWGLSDLQYEYTVR